MEQHVEQWIERCVCRNGYNTLQTTEAWHLIELSIECKAPAGQPKAVDDEDWELESLDIEGRRK